MSNFVSTWVWQQAECRGNDRLTLLAIADEADDDGFCYPGIPRLAKKARVARSTVIECLKRLEAGGHILVKRPARRGQGHHNEYLCVMDRDPVALATEHEWPRPQRWIDALAERSRSGTWTLDNGPAKVGSGRTLPKTPDPASSTSDEDSVEVPLPPARVANSVDDGPPPSRFDGPIHELATALTEVQLRVQFDIHDDLARTVVRLVDEHGVPTLVSIARDLTADFGGQPPRSVRAFVRPWARLQPPCGSCDPVTRRVTGSDGTPLSDGSESMCPACHPLAQRSAEGIRSA